MLCSDTHTIAKLLGGTTSKLTRVDFKDVCTDSRKPMQNALFLALKGHNFDAHNYIKQAEEMGAVAVIAQRKLDTNLPTIIVNNTQTALKNLASIHLQQIKPFLIAITGSNGKTSCKNMLKNILNLHAPTLKTHSNHNNHLGVPMTLLRLEKQHQFAVIEMGANHLREIANLCKIAPPDMALITNAFDAHLGEFGSKENLANAKAEIYTALKKDGFALIDKNSEFLQKWSSITKNNQQIFFGDDSDIFASNIKQNQSGLDFILNIKQQQSAIHLPMLGKHQAQNAVAASACAAALGIDIELIKKGLESTRPELGRLVLIQQNNLTLIDDTYNANPQAMKAAIKTLSNFNGETVAVLGSMGELGAESVALHQQIGQFASTLIDNIYSYGDLAKAYGGKHFDDLDALSQQILTEHPQATVLVKGSRMVQLDQLISKLRI